MHVRPFSGIGRNFPRGEGRRRRGKFLGFFYSLIPQNTHFLIKVGVGQFSPKSCAQGGSFIFLPLFFGAKGGGARTQAPPLPIYATEAFA